MLVFLFDYGMTILMITKFETSET